MASAQSARPCCKSIEEFRRRYLKPQDRSEWTKTDNPRVFGVNLAKESASRIRRLICPNTVH